MTQPQRKYILDLVEQREVPPANKAEWDFPYVERTEDVMSGKEVLQAEASKVIEWLKTLPRKGGLKVDVPDGGYAVESVTGNNDLDFYWVETPTEGKWEGHTFVKRVIGGHRNISVRREEVHQALDLIKRSGIEESGHLFSQELGRCRKCFKHLTDELSRELGIGPWCRRNAV
jgi:hypothetical protein